MRSQRVGHDWSYWTHTHTHTHWKSDPAHGQTWRTPPHQRWPFGAFGPPPSPDVHTPDGLTWLFLLLTFSPFSVELLQTCGRCPRAPLPAARSQQWPCPPVPWNMEGVSPFPHFPFTPQRTTAFLHCSSLRVETERLVSLDLPLHLVPWGPLPPLWMLHSSGLPPSQPLCHHFRYW